MMIAFRVIPRLLPGLFVIAAVHHGIGLAVAERLDRSAVAFPTGDGQVYIGWRLLAGDPPDIAFDVYRSEPPAGRLTRINSAPITSSTNYVDNGAGGRSWLYSIHAVAGGRTLDRTELFAVEESGEIGGLRRIRLQGPYAAQKVGIGDLNGDGKLDYLVKQPNFNTDPYQMPGYWKPSPETYKLEAYRHDGEFMWSYDMGWAIETGVWYSPIVVYDLDGDGKAEVYCKAGEGDPRGPDKRVTGGPEYLVKIDGETGKVVQKIPWIPREKFEIYRDEKRNYNLASRNFLGIAYLDGEKPSLIMKRGTYDVMMVVALDAALNLEWSWEASGYQRSRQGQGSHGIQVADVDGDGRDEIILGSLALDDDGTVLWSTGLGHPDVLYVADIDPDRPGLEVFYGHEWPLSSHGVALRDARTGNLIWGYEGPTIHVHGQGMVANIDPSRRGMECYAGERNGSQFWLYDAKGNRLSDESFGELSPRAVWWTGETHKLVISRGRMFEYNGPDHGQITGTVIAVADILGDWREEIIVSVEGEIHIYSTTIPADTRRVCLLQNRRYRTAVARQTMGYYYPPTLSGALFPEK